jgi:hypothetical protein
MRHPSTFRWRPVLSFDQTDDPLRARPKARSVGQGDHVFRCVETARSPALAVSPHFARGH